MLHYSIPPSFSKNISTIILESIKWVSKHSVDCPSCLSGLTSKIYHISIDRIGFYFFLVSLIFSEVRVPTMVGGNFQIYGAQITLDLDIFTHAPPD